MKNVASALIKAKANFKPVFKNKVNPHYKSKYAGLDGILDAIDTALAEQGLVVIQPCSARDGITIVTTTLIHAESGEQISSELAIPPTSDPQKLGSAITYYRRFTLCALLAIAPDDDDDGALAAKSGTKTNPYKQPTPTTPVVRQFQAAKAAVADCFETLGWSVEQRKEWAQGYNPEPSAQWSEKDWDGAVIALHQEISKSQTAPRF